MVTSFSTFWKSCMCSLWDMTQWRSGLEKSCTPRDMSWMKRASQSIKLSIAEWRSLSNLCTSYKKKLILHSEYLCKCQKCVGGYFPTFLDSIWLSSKGQTLSDGKVSQSGHKCRSPLLNLSHKSIVAEVKHQTTANLRLPCLKCWILKLSNAINVAK